MTSRLKSDHLFLNPLVHVSEFTAFTTSVTFCHFTQRLGLQIILLRSVVFRQGFSAVLIGQQIPSGLSCLYGMHKQMHSYEESTLRITQVWTGLCQYHNLKHYGRRGGAWERRALQVFKKKVIQTSLGRATSMGVKGPYF